nr:YhjD/YihY/BrkB family envelope integrity protein [Halorussus sp. DT72]
MAPVEMSVREALPGAVVAGVGWVALQVLFQFYLAHAGQYQAYGVIGAVLLLLTWLYFAGAVVLLGGVVNSVLGARIRLSG